ncbi:MAG: domain containing protein [Flavipsychrobacter sp.]|jgi:CHAD domain-containing protein|nr:domain containing protein [Flavipsychrobacter sp.]
MKEDKIKRVIAEKLEQISSCAEKVNERFDKDDIHDLRVSVKSLRSFLRLLKTIPSVPGLKIPGKMKQLYHIAGAIREAQLELDTISEKQYVLPAYTRKLEDTIADQKNEWAALYSGNIFREFSKKLEHNNYEKLNTADLSGFFSLKFGTISKLATMSDPSPDDLHQARKEVKDILYNTKTADQYWQASHPILRQIPAEKLDGTASKIGDYHDKVVMLEHLSSYSILLVPGEEKMLIKSIIEEDSPELEEEKAAIVGSLKDFTTPVSC